MIDAKEARRLYDESGAEVQIFLKHTVEPEVIKAAKAGKKHTHIHLGTLGPFDYLDTNISPIQRAIVDALKTLSFTAKIEKQGSSYIPAALRDDDGNGPSHTNFGITIGW